MNLADMNYIEILKNKIIELEQELEACNNKKLEYKEFYRESVNDVIELRQELGACNVEREDYRKYSKELEEDNKELTILYDNILDENHKLQDYIKKLEDYLEKAYKGQEDFKRIIKDKEKLINDLDTIIKEYDEENERLKNDYKVLANYNLDLLDEVEELQEIMVMRQNKLLEVVTEYCESLVKRIKVEIEGQYIKE